MMNYCFIGINYYENQKISGFNGEGFLLQMVRYLVGLEGSRPH